MKIGLVSCLNRSLDINFNISQIEKFCSLASKEKAELVCFGEAFVQGFNSLCWNIDIDKNTALSLDSLEISNIKSISRKYSIGISVGFIEFFKNHIYSSNIIIDKTGSIINVYRRVSPGWKTDKASSEYKEGSDFNKFKLNNISFSTAICGDLWFNENIQKINKLNPDIVLWPLYIDYSKKEWNNTAIFEYANQVKNIQCPVLLINSITENEANGGCVIFENGLITNKLEMGIENLFIFNK